MSNTVAVDCWLLSSGVSSFTSTSKLYFPANFSRKPRFGSNTIRASATTNGSSEGVIYKALLCGRRALLSMITLPLVMPCERIDNSVGAIAAEYVQIESFQVREEIRKVLSKSKAAGVLRLVFHDAGTFEIDEKTGGMNGSIVYELDRPENKGLKKSLKILDKAKSQIDLVQSVSWADIIALAGAEAVSLCGGPSIPIQLGRIDSMVQDPEGKLPEESLDAISLKQCFERKGFSSFPMYVFLFEAIYIQYAELRNLLPCLARILWEVKGLGIQLSSIMNISRFSWKSHGCPQVTNGIYMVSNGYVYIY
ncbi:probable L-ascorbate peroxidase 6, chloroplastic/mitochondrial isoform X4 [Solanum lycopersicum]|uniref:probable L-ascorbate peroxidase 6, chloroplastic/mitochondrial isoform X4 n=1 Tax=Solanum lycopersicum TaxID=4081 RepID=UPI0008FEB3D6|nr:probable L-ascorbate peroxidase 6, chloroplastic/mitochondrial isoform X7 [Solanum lycopersicum]